jgi:hypothetical protein
MAARVRVIGEPVQGFAVEVSGVELTRTRRPDVAFELARRINEPGADAAQPPAEAAVAHAEPAPM